MPNGETVEVNNPIARRVFRAIDAACFDTWSMERLATEARTTPAKVRRAIAELEELGLIRTYYEEN